MFSGSVSLSAVKCGRGARLWRRSRTLARAAVVLGGMAPLCGCLSSPLELQPLTVTLTATPLTAAVGQDIQFRYESRGSNLEGTVIDYGNGESESIAYARTSNAPVNIQTQGGVFDQAYETAGTYTARATVTDLAGAVQVAEVTVEITDP